MAITLRNYGIEVDGNWYIEPMKTSKNKGQIRCVFDIQVTPGESLSYADIRIYNLAGSRTDTHITNPVTEGQTVSAAYQTTAYSAKLPRVGAQIRLNAGWSTFDVDGSVQNEMRDFIFTGTITNVIREREGANIVTHLYCTSISTPQDKPVTNASYQSGVKLLDVMKDICSYWGKTLVCNEASFSGYVLTSGYVLMNDTFRELQYLSDAYGFSVYIERDTVVAQFNQLQRKNNPDFLISMKTGMIGVPEITLGTTGLGSSVRCRLNPYLRAESVYEIQSQYTTVSSGTNLFNVGQQNTTANGVYNVFGYRHRGDTHGSSWESAIDGLQPATQSDFTTNGKMAWGTKVEQDFRVKVRAVAKALNLDASWLMAIMYHESGISTTAKNPMSTATGLIQFTRSTAISLGTTTVALARMTPVEQMDYVQKYFEQYKGRISNLTDCYMAVFYPNAMGQPDSYVIATAPSATYNANANLDSNHDGVITRAEAVAPVMRALRSGQVNAI